MKCGGIVLCGGLSRRMGSDKAWLPFGAETMLGRVVRILGEAVSPLVVVAAATARLPDLPPHVRIAFDRRAERGPLDGLAVGLAAMAALRNDESASNAALGELGAAASELDAAYVTSCDAPLLRPEFVCRMIGLLGGAEAAVPRADGRLHPLAAVYRLGVLPEAERRLAANRLRLTEFVEALRARIVEPAELCDIDPELRSLQNVNDPEAYRAALAAAGL